ncbi:hypothetical protein Gotur_032675 [Gossypium turneri]
MFRIHLTNLKKFKERFDSDNYVKKALGKKWRDHKSTLKKEYFFKKYKPRREIAKCPAGNAEVPMGRCG